MTIIWKNFTTWDSLVRDTLSYQHAIEVIAKMKEVDTSEYFTDDPDWFTLLANHSGSSIEDIELALAKKLSSQTLRMYHGCRPVNLSSYTSQGLRIHRHAELVENLRKLVQSDPRLSSIDLDDRIKKVPRQYDDGKSFLTFDERFMVEYAGHYIIYGGEWTAAVLGDGNRQPLLERGTPTILLIDLPAHMAGFDVLKGLARDMLTEWARQVISMPDSVRMIDSGVVLEHDLDAQYIVGHEHPECIKDPWNSHQIYKVKNQCCP